MDTKKREAIEALGIRFLPAEMSMQAAVKTSNFPPEVYVIVDMGQVTQENVKDIEELIVILETLVRLKGMLRK